MLLILHREGENGSLAHGFVRQLVDTTKYETKAPTGPVKLTSGRDWFTNSSNFSDGVDVVNSTIRNCEDHLIIIAFSKGMGLVELMLSHDLFKVPPWRIVSIGSHGDYSPIHICPSTPILVFVHQESDKERYRRCSKIYSDAMEIYTTPFPFTLSLYITNFIERGNVAHFP
jgi:hypothetical protein